MDIDYYASRLSDGHMAMFLLHGVIDAPLSDVRNYNRKHILKDELAGLIKRLKQIGQALSPDEYLIIREEGGRLPKNAFVLTFDDGFENNYSVAAPVLDDMQVPGIVYVTSRFVDENRMSWIDRIDYAVEKTDKKALLLSIFPALQPIGTVAEKIALLQNIRARVKEDKSLFLAIDDFIDEVFDECGVAPVHAGEGQLDKKMNWHQVAELNRHPLFSIGGHTHNHSIMSYLNDNELEQDVRVCLDKIEAAIGEKPRHFCYPEGLAHCYNNDVIDCLKRHDIVCSPSAIDGINDLSTDPFHLKRIFVV